VADILHTTKVGGFLALFCKFLKGFCSYCRKPVYGNLYHDGDQSLCYSCHSDYYNGHWEGSPEFWDIYKPPRRRKPIKNVPVDISSLDDEELEKYRYWDK
jgi:hypothetical protein